MNEILEKISEIGIVPVIAINDADKAVPLARPLKKRLFSEMKAAAYPS